MAQRRQGPFPIDGELVTAEDGVVWMWLAGAWERAGEVLSLAEAQRATDQDLAARKRLDVAARVWERAAAAAPWIRVRGQDIRSTDPLPTFVELLARAALTDCIAETCDGRPLGMAAHTTQQVTSLLGPGLMRRVASMLQRHLIVVTAEDKLSGR